VLTPLILQLRRESIFSTNLPNVLSRTMGRNDLESHKTAWPVFSE